MMNEKLAVLVFFYRIRPRTLAKATRYPQHYLPRQNKQQKRQQIFENAHLLIQQTT